MKPTKPPSCFALRDLASEVEEVDSELTIVLAEAVIGVVPFFLLEAAAK